MSDSWLNGYYLRDDYYRNVARGLVADARLFGAYGRRTTSGAETNVVWPDGAYAFPPAAGVQLSIASTSANDAAAGTGLRTVELHYLDANLDEQYETITLNGLTPVLTVATNIRFAQCVHRVTSGTGKVAAGTISASVGAQIYTQISTGAVRCSSSVRMVPRGMRLLIYALEGGSVSGTAAAQTVIEFATPSFDGHNYITDSVFIPLASAAVQDASLALPLEGPMAFTEGQACGMTFTTDKAATIVASWFGILEKV
jgi:hypothetical protein